MTTKIFTGWVVADMWQDLDVAIYLDEADAKLDVQRRNEVHARKCPRLNERRYQVCRAPIVSRMVLP